MTKKKLRGGGPFNNNIINNSNSNETLSIQKYIILALVVYFGSKIYFNIYTSTINQEVKTRNSPSEVLNFAATFILFFIYMFIKKPEWHPLDMKNYGSIILAFIISFLYSSSIAVLENQTKKEEANNSNGDKKYLLYFVYGLYILIGGLSLWMGIKHSTNWRILLGGVFSVLIVYIILIFGRKNRENTNITIGLYGYLLLFLLPQKETSSVIVLRNILLVSTFSIFSFLGVRYFTGDTKDVSFMDRTQKCNVSYNNIDSEELSQKNTIIVKEKGNNALNVAFISISCLFMITFIFLYIFMNKNSGNTNVNSGIVENI